VQTFDDYPDLPDFLDRRKYKPTTTDAAAASGPDSREI